MPFFTPPAQSTVPPILPVNDPEQTAAAFNLMRHFRARPEGINVYVLSDGTITETDPDATTVFWAESDTTRTTEPYVTFVFWGATGPYEITDEMADALTAEGYNVDGGAEPSDDFALLIDATHVLLIDSTHRLLI